MVFQTMFTARPTSKDTEDDLLKYQQDFLSSKATPAAKVVRAEKRKSDDTVRQSPTPNTDGGKDVVTLGGTCSIYSYINVYIFMLI